MIHRKTFIPFEDPKVDLTEYLIGIMEDARTTTLQRVQGISVEELDWQYAEGWNSIGALLAHVISCENFFRIYFVERRALTKDEEEKWMPGLELGKFVPSLICGKPIEVYIEEMSASRKTMFEQIRLLSREDFIKPRMGSYDPVTGYNLAWGLYHNAEDEVHHRGQISILRKIYKTQSQRIS